MNRTPTEIVAANLDEPDDTAHVRSVCAADVIYVPLNYEDSKLIRDHALPAHPTAAKRSYRPSLPSAAIGRSMCSHRGPVRFRRQGRHVQPVQLHLDGTVEDGNIAVRLLREGQRGPLQLFSYGTYVCDRALVPQRGSWTISSNPNSEHILF
jgi:hypothetical protein